MLETRNLQACYGEMTALWGVDLNIRPGELVAVVGPNGAGKSTLINAISGLVDVPDGQLRWNGSDIVQASAESRVRNGIIQCPEGRKLFPEMTVEENLLMGPIAELIVVASTKALKKFTFSSLSYAIVVDKLPALCRAASSKW